MIRTVFFSFVLGSLLTAPAGSARADDQKPAKQEDNKSTKPETVKASQTTKVGRLTGKITARGDNSFTLEAGKEPAKKTYELLIAEDAKIRLPAELQFDEKGKPKPFHKDPSDPNRSMPGVRGTKEDLRDGQNVIVTIGRLPNKKLVATVILVVADKK